MWATDLWFAPTENLTTIRDAGVADGVFPIHADARALPFATGLFDAIVSTPWCTTAPTTSTWLTWPATCGAVARSGTAVR